MLHPSILGYESLHYQNHITNLFKCRDDSTRLNSSTMLHFHYKVSQAMANIKYFYQDFHIIKCQFRPLILFISKQILCTHPKTTQKKNELRHPHPAILNQPLAVIFFASLALYIHRIHDSVPPSSRFCDFLPLFCNFYV